MKTWVIVGAAVGLLAVLGLGTIYYVAGTPQYSLYLLRRAAREGDRDAFYHYFDVDGVVTHAVEHAVGGVKAGPRVVSQKAVDTLIPASSMLIKQRIEERLDDPDSAPILGMSVDSVRYQNNAAFVTLKSPSDGTPTTLMLERMSDRHWKVVDLDLAKANVQYSLDEARERAEDLLPPETPQVTRPGLTVPPLTHK
jgi:hypothetical protein